MIDTALIRISKKDTDRKKNDIVYSLSTKGGRRTCYDLKKLKQGLEYHSQKSTGRSKFEGMKVAKKDGWQDVAAM